jgi:hypothetical protein
LLGFFLMLVLGLNGERHAQGEDERQLGHPSARAMHRGVYAGV